MEEVTVRLSLLRCEKDHCLPPGKNAPGEMQRPVVPNPRTQVRPSRLETQKPISNPWLVVTFCKRDLAEQIPPETADLAGSKDILHAEF